MESGVITTDEVAIKASASGALDAKRASMKIPLTTSSTNENPSNGTEIPCNHGAEVDDEELVAFFVAQIPRNPSRYDLLQQIRRRYNILRRS